MKRRTQCSKVFKMASNKSSVSNAKSYMTSASSVSAVHARAKAEAAKLRASYASQEAKLKLEKAARKPERKTGEAQSQLETARIETELQVLTLKREVVAAVIKAQVLEDVAEIHDILGNVKSESEERLRLEPTCSYVHSKTDQNQSNCAPVPVPFVKSPDHVESRDSLITWHPSASISEFQLKDTEPKPGSDDKVNPPSPNLPKLPRIESKTEVKRTNPHMFIGAQPQTPHHVLPASPSHNPDPLAQYLA